MKKMLSYLILVIILISLGKISFAKEESTDKIYHFIFKIEQNITNEENEAIMETFRKKTDILGIAKCSIRRDGSNFIVTYKTSMKPEDCIAEIKADNFSVPITLLSYFVCDTYENKELFLKEDYSPTLK